MERFGESVRLVPCDSIEDVFTVVEGGKCDYGVVPLENSTIGSINMTFDRFLSSQLKIRSETQISVFVYVCFLIASRLIIVCCLRHLLSRKSLEYIHTLKH